MAECILGNLMQNMFSVFKKAFYVLIKYVNVYDLCYYKCRGLDYGTSYFQCQNG